MTMSGLTSTFSVTEVDLRRNTSISYDGAVAQKVEAKTDRNISESAHLL
jgi:hypothetical protein